MTHLLTNGSKRILIIAVVLAVLGTVIFAGPAAAASFDDEDVDATNWICQNSDTAFVEFISLIMNVFFALAMMFGIVTFAMDYLNKAAGGSDSFAPLGLKDVEGKQALKAGFGLPIGIWFITFLADALLGYNFSCIVPLQ